MAAYQVKYHIGLNSVGYILSQKRGIKYYQKKKAPEFVNKFGSGDSSYRDNTFWQFFVQTNWRNGCKQLKFDDFGKFWKSSNVDTSQLEKLSLSNLLTSAGQVASGIKINTLDSWKASASGAFGDGSDNALTISNSATDAPIDASCAGTAGTNTLTATNVSFAAPQKILIHQSRGTNAGKWEINSIAGYSTGVITTGSPLVNTYTSSGADAAQVLVLKQYTNVTIDAAKTLTAKAWDGTVGGILAFLAKGTVTVNGTISGNGGAGASSVQTGGSGGGTGGGFRGGNIRSAPTTPGSGYQGEGTAGVGSESYSANGNGGCGGLDSSSFTGGGGNGTAGNVSESGYGGAAVGTADLTTMLFGGGGGGGTCTGDPGNHPNARGGAGGSGGAIIFIGAISLIVNTGGAITATGGAGGNPVEVGCQGGGGAGGSILMRVQTGVLGASLITANGGAKGTGGGGTGTGGAGRIHIDYLTSYTGTTTPTLDAKPDNSLTDIAASTSSTGIAGGSNGKIYSWDNATAWTEMFDCRKLEWYETGNDTDKLIGDVADVETAQAQSFQLDASVKVKAVQVYLKKNAGTPGDITVTIETNSTDKPSGTLAHANATTTVPAFTTATYGWVTIEFTTNFSLSASTVYWIVLKTAAAATNINYAWASDASSPSYTPGTMAVSVDGGATWAAVTVADAYFRVLGNSTSINSSLITSIGGTKKIYFGTGNPTGTENSDARLYSYDGSNWVLTKVMTSECTIASLAEYSEVTKVYLGTGGYAKVYETADFTTFTLAKDIDVPQNPGYVYAMKEYNSVLYAGGGSPEIVPTQYYSGFLFYYDSTKWRNLYPFDFTVIKSLEFYDAYLFMGTYHGHVYVFDTASLNPLFNFKDDYAYQLQIFDMQYFDDRLYIGTYPQEGTGDTNAGVWKFDRRGISLAHTASGVTGYRCFAVVNGDLLVGTGDDGYVYKLDETKYAATGWYQSSYYDANLPNYTKLYNSVTVKHDPLTVDHSIVVYYKYKESDSWTTLGTSNTLNATEKEILFPAGTNSKKITLKVELNTTNSLTTPVLTEVVLKYTLYPIRRWQWNLRLLLKENINLLDNSLENRTAATMRSAIENLLSSQTLYTFVDIDATSYNVLVVDTDQTSWVINQDATNEDEINITLLEA